MEIASADNLYYSCNCTGNSNAAAGMYANK